MTRLVHYLTIDLEVDHTKSTPRGTEMGLMLHDRLEELRSHGTRCIEASKETAGRISFHPEHITIWYNPGMKGVLVVALAASRTL